MEKRSMMRVMAPLVAFSLLSCAVERPNIDLGIVNAPAGHVKAYNYATDYDQNGALVPGAKAKFYPAAKVSDLNNWLCLTIDAGPE